MQSKQTSPHQHEEPGAAAPGSPAALAEAALLADPARTNRTIAALLDVAINTVRSVRQRLEDAGRIPVWRGDATGDPLPGTAAAQIVAALLTDCARSNTVIATVAGTDRCWVRAWRHKLEEQGRIPIWRGKGGWPPGARKERRAPTVPRPRAPTAPAARPAPPAARAKQAPPPPPAPPTPWMGDGGWGVGDGAGPHPLPPIPHPDDDIRQEIARLARVIRECGGTWSLAGLRRARRDLLRLHAEAWGVAA